MMEERKIKKKLSKSILDMKFMKKSREAAMAAQEDEEGQAMFASDLTEAMKLGGIRYIIEPSFVPCEELSEARRSYQGMNPEIERYLSEKYLPKIDVKEEEEVDVNVEEMALTTSMAKKFVRGQPPRKKAKFMKPSDD